jgi:hypothetical protein
VRRALSEASCLGAYLYASDEDMISAEAHNRKTSL